jgi:hypothetical protein
MKRGATGEWLDPTAPETLRSQPWSRPFRGTGYQTAVYRKLLREEIEQQVVRPIPREEVRWCNPTFVIVKKSGEGRKILDCSRLNEYLIHKSFKMEDMRLVVEMLQPGDWGATLDLKSAYLHVPVQPDFQPFLAFNFEDRFYCYTGMPFGLKPAPRIFTLLMRRVIQSIRQALDCRLIVYMDDVLVLGRTQ